MLKHHTEDDPEYLVSNNNAIIFFIFIMIVFFVILVCAFTIPQPKYDKPVIDVRIVRDDREEPASNAVVYRASNW